MYKIPLVSVIMPIRNEANFIARSLGAVLAQDYPSECLEILVADGISNDTTRDVVLELSKRNPHIRLQIIDNRASIVPTGFNAALERSRGSIIVRVDGHTIIAPNYISECVNALMRSDADNVGGRMTAVGESNFAKAVALATSSRFGVGGSKFHYVDREAWVDTVYMGAWPRAVFEKLGLFDEEQVRNQDDEFNYRMREAGLKILLCPQIRSIYYNRARPKSLFWQYYQYGYWKVRVMQKHPSQMRLHHFAPPLFVLSVIGCVAFAFASLAGKYCLGAIVAAYLICNLGATLVVAARARIIYLPSISLAFLLIHVGYGMGFLIGLLKFRARWKDHGVRKVLSSREVETAV